MLLHLIRTHLLVFGLSCGMVGAFIGLYVGIALATGATWNTMRADQRNGNCSFCSSKI
jgi:hypothetical protein